MIRLGVNLDHVATVRQARGEPYPDPIQAATLAEMGGADNITFHLREDRRHIQDHDVERFAQTATIPLNMEMALTDEMIGIACRIKPHTVTLVPEKREELTTEGGLAVREHSARLREGIARLADGGIFVALFVEPDKEAVILSRELGAGAVELHTGGLVQRLSRAHSSRAMWSEIDQVAGVCEDAHAAGLQVHCGHGLHYQNAHWLQALPWCEEANIGHSIIARAIYSGLEQSVRDMKALLNDPKFRPQRTLS